MNKEWESFLTDGHGAIGPSASIHRELPINSNVGANIVCPVNGFEILSVFGKDAETFLQGQCTCDMSKIDQASFSFGAFCDPKGRVLATFRVSKRDDDYYWLVIASDLMDAIQKRLRRYVFRSDVTLQPVSDWLLLGVSGPQVITTMTQLGLPMPDEKGLANHNREASMLYLKGYPDRCLMMASHQRAKEICCALWAEYSFEQGSSSDWVLWEMNNGIVQITASHSGEFTPQMINIDLVGGVSFEKGCYTGQEVIARTHYLGKPKRRVFLATCNSNARLSDGLKIISEDGDAPLGMTVATASTSQAGYMLAVLKTDAVQENQRNLYLASGAPINLLNLPYT